MEKDMILIWDIVANFVKMAFRFIQIVNVRLFINIFWRKFRINVCNLGMLIDLVHRMQLEKVHIVTVCKTIISSFRMVGDVLQSILWKMRKFHAKIQSVLNSQLETRWNQKLFSIYFGKMEKFNKFTHEFTFGFGCNVFIDFFEH